MKTSVLKKVILSLTMLAFLVPVKAAEFKADEDIVISSDVKNNLYLAAGSISSYARIFGDVIAAGGKISINDTVFGDVTLAGSDLLLNAPVKGDARLFGENINVLKNLDGDLVVFGGLIEVSKDAVIEGDLVVFGGFVVVHGTVNGNVLTRGGRVKLNGTVLGKLDVSCEHLVVTGEVAGPSRISVEELEFGTGASFGSDVRYWTEDGEMDFGPYMRSGSATFDNDLKFKEIDIDWEAFALGLAGLWLLFTISVVLVIILLQFLFGKTFERGVKVLDGNFARSLGYGVLYFVALPVIAVFFMITIIGLPVGFLLMSIFCFSLMFAFSITAVVAANWLKLRYNKNWGNWMLILMAVLSFIVMRIIAWIPFIGGLVVMLLIFMAFGALLYLLVTRRKAAEPVAEG